MVAALVLKILVPRLVIFCTITNSITTSFVRFRDGGARTTACLWLMLVSVVVGRCSKDLFVFFVTFWVLSTIMDVYNTSVAFFTKKCPICNFLHHTLKFILCCKFAAPTIGTYLGRGKAQLPHSNVPSPYRCDHQRRNPSNGGSEVFRQDLYQPIYSCVYSAHASSPCPSV
jgi:hypothetical protein